MSQCYTAVQPIGFADSTMPSALADASRHRCRLRFAKANRSTRLTMPALTAFRGQKKMCRDRANSDRDN